MDEKEDGETENISLARQGRKAWAFVVNWRWRGVMVLSFYEIAFGITPFVLSLELSSWARYNLWAYLVLHSAAFFKALWDVHSALSFRSRSSFISSPLWTP